MENTISMFNQTTLWIIIVSFLVPICATIGMVQVLRWRRKHFKQPERLAPRS